MPLLGLGVWETPSGDVGLRAMLDALEGGYRHIDTAAVYGNEATVGVAIGQSGLDRSDIFITSKVWNRDQGYDKTLRAFDKSLALLDLDYLDLYLVHWPVERLRLDTWRALETLAGAGRVRAIGVSNYMVRHLEELATQSDVVPAVNQIELHPYNFRSRLEVVEYCQCRGIAVEAYCPLARGRRLKDPELVAIAGGYGKTPAQIMIRWSLQHGFIVIPKSIMRSRILENADVYDFILSQQDMDLLDSFDENLASTWDPTNAP